MSKRKSDKGVEEVEVRSDFAKFSNVTEVVQTKMEISSKLPILVALSWLIIQIESEEFLLHPRGILKDKIS